MDCVIYNMNPELSIWESSTRLGARVKILGLWTVSNEVVFLCKKNKKGCVGFDWFEHQTKKALECVWMGDSLMSNQCKTWFRKNEKKLVTHKFSPWSVVYVKISRTYFVNLTSKDAGLKHSIACAKSCLLTPEGAKSKSCSSHGLTSKKLHRKLSANSAAVGLIRTFPGPSGQF